MTAESTLSAARNSPYCPFGDYPVDNPFALITGTLGQNTGTDFNQMFIHYSLVKFFERTNFWGILADQGQLFYIIMTDSNFKDKPHLNGQLSLIISVLAMKSINIQVTLSSMTSSSSLLASPYPSNPSSGEKGKLGVSV